ncbi:Redox-sensitive transcriptional activator SoxR [compost metagenome]
MRSDGGRRLYPQDALRRIAFIRVAQGMGLSLGEIGEALAGLPDGRTPDRGDWERIASQWQGLLDRRIEALQLMKRKLTSCIGCGCLSLDRCALYNPADQAAGQGPVFAISLVPVGRGEWLLVRHDPEPARFPLLTHPLAIFVSHYLA